MRWRRSHSAVFYSWFKSTTDPVDITAKIKSRVTFEPTIVHFPLCLALYFPSHYHQYYLVEFILLAPRLISPSPLGDNGVHITRCLSLSTPVYLAPGASLHWPGQTIAWWPHPGAGQWSQCPDSASPGQENQHSLSFPDAGARGKARLW